MRRRGLTLVELAVSTALSTMILGMAIALLSSSSRMEKRTDTLAEAVSQSAKLYCSLVQDLREALPGSFQVEASEEVGTTSVMRLVRYVEGSDIPQPVEYLIEGGTLIRHSEGGKLRRFELGRSSSFLVTPLKANDLELPSFASIRIQNGSPEAGPGHVVILETATPLSQVEPRFQGWNPL